MDNSKSKEQLVKMIMDTARRTIGHYGLWLREVEHQFGLPTALEVEKEAGDKGLGIMMKRFGKILGFEVKDGAPAPLYDLDETVLEELLDGMSANWLVNDGVWFQAVEKRYGMFDAKRCNDSCWTRFSPLEASRIKSLLELPEQGGIPALKTALEHRIYSRINVQGFDEETENSIVFKMVDCRVQSARTRKNMEEYPCKSAGVVEYRTFAQTIDSRIKTECIACPPDSHPDDYFCAWRFTLEE